MAAGVNVKMGVSGVAQFKAGMKDSQMAVKTLNEQLKLNEAQLRATGNEEAFLQNKTELLQKQIQEQTRIVQQAESALKAMRQNGVAETSREFQAMQQQLYRANTDLTNMQTQLQNVGTSGAEAGQGLQDVNTQLDSIARNTSLENLGNGINSIIEKMQSAARAALNMGRSILNATLGAGEEADRLKTAADQYSTEDWIITPEDVQRMEYASTKIDTSVEAIINAQARLRSKIGSADSGVLGAYAELIGEGYDPRTQDSVDAFWAIGDALMHMSDATEQEAYAQKLFGRGWRELKPLFKAGREEYEATLASASVASNEVIDSLGAMNDAEQDLNQELKTLELTALSTLSGPLTAIMDKLTELFRQFNEYLQTDEGKEAMQAISDTIMTLVEDFTNIDPESVMAKFKEIIDGIRRAFEWIRDNKDTVITALEAIAGGFIALKVASLGIDIAKIFSGFGAGAGAGAAMASGAQAGASALSGAAASGGGGLLAKLGLSAGSIGLAAVPAAVLALGIGVPAYFQGQLEKEWQQTLQTRLSAAQGLQGMDRAILEAAAQASYQHGRPTGDAEALLRGMGGWTMEEKMRLAQIVGPTRSSGGNYAMNELVRLWNGEEFDQGRIESLVAAVADAYAEMGAGKQNEIDLAEAVTAVSSLPEVFAGVVNVANAKLSSDIGAALANLDGLPREVGRAVEAGMANVTIVISQTAMDQISTYAGRSMWNYTMNEIK